MPAEPTRERVPGDPAATLTHATIADTASAIRSGATTAEALVEACLERIARLDPAINAFIAVTSEQARADARTADRELAGGKSRGPLHGVPISIKDIIDVSGTATTCASRVRTTQPARRDAAAVARLRDAGAIVIGKTNLHEFAFGTTNEDSAFGPVHHPIDASRSPGGSSGGSAAAVLAGMTVASIGTDTGGSVRIPAAACGLVGLKPELGEIPLDGVIPLSATLDHVGPICRSVDDAAALYNVMRGARDCAALADVDLRSVRLGVLRGYFTALLEPPVARAFEQACARLSEAGATLEEVDVPHAGDIAPVYLHIVLAEAAAAHATTLENRADDYTPNVRIRLEMGRYILAEDYVRALRGRELLTREVDAAVTGRTALLLPTLPLTAPKLGATMVTLSGTDEPIRNAMLRLTQLFNITGHPAITLPCTPAGTALPIGVQLAGARHKTLELLGVARAVERHLGQTTQP
jgi:aspartyl-tRNA(Asn)/glutamyl-tRNA(Gln) amidotransferase subunit A